MLLKIQCVETRLLNLFLTAYQKYFLIKIRQICRLCFFLYALKNTMRRDTTAQFICKGFIQNIFPLKSGKSAGNALQKDVLSQEEISRHGIRPPLIFFV
jgi:hypothetical protein